MRAVRRLTIQLVLALMLAGAGFMAMPSPAQAASSWWKPCFLTSGPASDCYPKAPPLPHPDCDPPSQSCLPADPPTCSHITKTCG